MRRLTGPVACPMRGNEICSTGTHGQTGTLGPVDSDHLITLRLAEARLPDSPQQLLMFPWRGSVGWVMYATAADRIEMKESPCLNSS